jgi:hypothetical protein
LDEYGLSYQPNPSLSSPGDDYYQWAIEGYGGSGTDWYIFGLDALRAVPEPASIAVWALLGAMAGIGWRWRSKSKSG